MDMVPPTDGAVDRGGFGQPPTSPAPSPSPEIPIDTGVAALREALVNLSATQGRQAKELKSLAADLEKAQAKILALTSDVEKITALAEKYRPAVEKFINGPGRLLLKV